MTKRRWRSVLAGTIFGLSILRSIYLVQNDGSGLALAVAVVVGVAAIAVLIGSTRRADERPHHVNAAAKQIVDEATGEPPKVDPEGLR